MGITVLIFGAAFFFLMRSSGFLVHSVTGLARLFRVSEYLAAFILMSAATSIPELFVGITSAIRGIPQLSLGNILGANLLNLTVVIGASALMTGGLEVEDTVSRKNFWMIFVFSLLPFLLGLDGSISRADGLALLVTFAIFTWHILEEREHFTRRMNHYPHGFMATHRVAHDLALFAIGIAVLLASSYAIVWSAQKITTSLAIGLLPFGILIVALGTTLPELMFGIRSALARYGSLAVGNSLGSIAFNATFIVGLVSLIHPIPIAVGNHSLWLLAAFIAAFVFFNILLYQKSRVTRASGAILIAFYAAYVVLESLY